MLKKALYLLVAIPLLLASCSILPSSGSNNSTGSGASANPNNGAFSDPSKMPVQNKLAIGILKLEGTPQAVTPEQAKTLLPLFKALKSLESNNNTAADEITALYQQIQDALTADQVTAIQKLTWTQADLQALMKEYGVQFAQGGNFGNLTDAQRATRVAQFAQNGGGTARSGGNGGNGGGGFGGGFVAGGNGANGPQARSTPRPGVTPGARRGLGGFNALFVDPVIKLLTQRAGA